MADFAGMLDPTLREVAAALLARACDLETAPGMGRSHLLALARGLLPDTRHALLELIDAGEIRFQSSTAYDALYTVHERWVEDNRKQHAA